MSDPQRRPGELHGRPGTQRVARGFFVTDGLYPPSLRIEPHAHELASLCLVTAGAYLRKLALNPSLRATCETGRSP
jgi:hypothetical protein